MKKSMSVKLAAMYVCCGIVTATLAVGIGFATNSIIDSVKSDAAASVAEAQKAMYDTSQIQQQTTHAAPDESTTESNVGDEAAIVSDIGSEQNKSEYENENSDDISVQSVQNNNSPKNPIEDENTIKNNKYVVLTETGDAVYYINSEDTLSYISSVTGYSVDELAEYNCIRNVDLIYAGSALRIPDED